MGRGIVAFITGSAVMTGDYDRQMFFRTLASASVADWFTHYVQRKGLTF
jgi:hypothetical protein